MKQLLQNLRTGQTAIVDVPMPIAKPGTALVRTAASLVSAGTERMLVEFAEKSLLGKARSRPDLVRQLLDKARREGLLTTVEAAFNRLDQPMPLGYSSAGTVVAVGAGVQKFHPGDRVACAGGNYAVHAEYAVVPENLLARLPDDVDFEAAAFTTLGAIALHGFRLAQVQLGETVGVIGLGLLGLLSVGIVQAAGCQVFGVDLDAGRVRLANQLGARAALREQAEEAALAFSRGRGLDALLICADTKSDDPVQLAGVVARDRARVVAVGAVGLNIPRKIYYEKELSFVNSRSYGPGRYDPAYEEGGRDYPLGYVRWSEGRNLEAIVDLLHSGRLDVHPLISHRYPIEKAPQAYELITGKIKEPFLGVLLTYPDAPGEEAVLKTPVHERNGRTAPHTTEKVRLGVLGAGNFATAVMLPAIKDIPAIEKIAIASGAGAHAQHAASKFAFGYVAKSEEEILADPQVNCMAILTRHDLHAAQTLRALQAGKHVFCEKPLALKRQELAAIGEQLARQAQTSGEGNINPLLMVGFNRRFAPLAVKMHAFISQRHEPFAAHYRVNAGYIPLTHWVHNAVEGGGRIIGEGCHFIDFLTFLAGQPPIKVTAHSLPDAGRYQSDNIVLIFTFPDGSLGTISYLANGDKAFPKERVEVFAGGRVAVLDDFRSLEMVHAGKRQKIHSRLRQDKGHQAEWIAFSKAILDGGPPPIPYAHLLGVTQASFAAIEALQSQQEQTIAQAA
ncbi:MAG: bi-domain-containing oxidoreductase [Anaerolineales bacterium]|nr:bi-domain-containing oxidoreductase [Anaerolineales bacterium]